MNHKKGNVHVHVAPTKLAKSAVVTVGFQFDSGCYLTLMGLKSGCCKCSDSPYSSALMYALCRFVKSKLRATHADELNSQITDMSCNYQNGEFNITAQCAGTVSGIRKAACGILKNLKPANVFPVYKASVKQLMEDCDEKFSLDRKIFTYLVDQMVKSINKGVTVLVGGKANLKAEQLRKVAESCASKLSVMAPKGDKENPKESRSKPEDCLVKCKGFEAVYTKRYLESKIGSQLHLIDNCLCGSNQHNTAIKRLAKVDFIKRHVGTRYKKFKTDLAPAMVYLAMINNLTDTSTLIKHSKSKVTGQSIVNAIKDCL